MNFLFIYISVRFYSCSELIIIIFAEDYDIVISSDISIYNIYKFVAQIVLYIYLLLTDSDSREAIFFLMPLKRRWNLVHFFYDNLELGLILCSSGASIGLKLRGKYFIVQQFYKLFFTVAKLRSTSLVWLYIFLHTSLYITDEFLKVLKKLWF